MHELTGEPVPEARVWISATRLISESPPSTHAGPHGRFRLDVDARGVAYAFVAAKAGGKALLSTKVLIPRGQAHAELLLEVPGRGAVTGRIEDAGSRPVPDCFVGLTRGRYLRGPSEPAYLHTGKTDGDGAFTLENVPRGEWLLVYGTDQNVSGRRVVVEAGRATSVNASMPAGWPHRLTGVVTKDGEPVTEGAIRFVSLNPDPARLIWPVGWAVSGLEEDGRYSVTGVPPGRYLVQASPNTGNLPGGGGPEGEEWERQIQRRLPGMFVKTVEVKEGQETLDIAMPKSSVNGSIVDSQGGALKMGSVILAPADVRPALVPLYTTITGDGVFRFNYVEPGTYDLVVEARSYGAFVKPGLVVGRGETSVRWRLEEPAVVKGTIRHIDGEPVRDARILVVSEENPNHRTWTIPRQRSWPRHLKEENHHLRMGYGRVEMAPGRYRLFAAKPDYSCEYEAVHLEGEYDFSPTLVPAGEVQVQLMGPEAEITGRTVRAWDEDGEEVLRLRGPGWTRSPLALPSTIFLLPTDRYGRTTIEGLRPGCYRITVDGAKAEAHATVEALKATMVSLRLP